MRYTTYDCSILELPQIGDPSGSIAVLQNNTTSPFEIKRIYYLYDVPGGASRGGHAHRQLEQLIVAVSGSFDICLDDGRTRRTVMLNRPYYGLHLRPGIWRELHNFSSGAVCLVLASEIYDEQDYIRDYAAFQHWKLHDGADRV